MLRRIVSMSMLVVLAPLGCEGSSFRWPGQTATQPAGETALQRQMRKLQADLETLEAENTALKLRIESLKSREAVLAQRCHILQFTIEQQKRQIVAIKPAIKERDAAQADVKKLTVEVERLKKRNAELQRLTNDITPASASRPAGK